ncbi:MAG: hypothetical protein ABIA93_01085 [Candidatus Woesearchaeota archaeon]
MNDTDEQNCRITQSFMRGRILREMRESLDGGKVTLQGDYSRAIETGDPSLAHAVSREMLANDQDFTQLELDLHDTANDMRSAEYTLGILENISSQVREDALVTRKNLQNLSGLASKYNAVLTIVQRLEGYAPGKQNAQLKEIVERAEKQSQALGRLSMARVRSVYAIQEAKPLGVQQAYTDPRAREQRLDRLFDEVETMGKSYVKRRSSLAQHVEHPICA